MLFRSPSQVSDDNTSTEARQKVESVQDPFG
jgi:hypothetical protein